MKNFALLNSENIVLNISVGSEDWDSTGWVEYTGKNCNIGYTYDEVKDGFIPPKCHDEAVLNEELLWDCENADHEAFSF
jgi:hypothetical protein